MELGHGPGRKGPETVVEIETTDLLASARAAEARMPKGGNEIG